MWRAIKSALSHGLRISGRAWRYSSKWALRPAFAGRADVLERRELLSASGPRIVEILARDRVGNTFKKARDMGAHAPGNEWTFTERVGGSDKNDYFRIDVQQSLRLDINLENLTRKADLYLYRADRSLIIDSRQTGTQPEWIWANLDPGTYFIRVAGKQKPTGYSLRLDTAPLGGSGNSVGSDDGGGGGGGGGSGGGGGGGGGGGPVASAIPAQGIYDIFIAGTTYWGDTNFLATWTNFYAQETFSLFGVLAMSSTIDTTNASNNGLNGRDIGINTGNIGLGGAGVFEYATNTLLHQLWGGNDGQGAAIDLAYVSTDEAGGRITIQADTNKARISQLNTMFRSGGLLALPFQIIAVAIDINFFDGGTRIVGSVSLWGEGYIEAGTAAITANFEGQLR